MRLSKPRFLCTIVGILTLAVASLTAHSRAFGASESILWNFGNGTDGQTPYANLIMDASANLYGTTGEGGAYGAGTVFKLTAGGNESVLWNFGNGTDGAFPKAGLIMDTSGNLYGTTAEGGAYSYGTVFKLTPGGSEPVLWSFNGTDGVFPHRLIMDTSGNLYGTTAGGRGLRLRDGVQADTRRE